jgi:hypothetical protein
MSKSKKHTPSKVAAVEKTVIETPEQEVAEAGQGAPAEVSAVGKEMSPEERDEAKKLAAKNRRLAKRKEREDLGAIGEQKLVAPTRPGFKRYWAVDEGNRLAILQDRGYTFVESGGPYSQGIHSTDIGENISQVTGTGKDGAAQRSYLMEIPDEFYLEDQKSKEISRQAIEKQLRKAAHGKDSLGAGGNSTAYTPDNSNFSLE